MRDWLGAPAPFVIFVIAVWFGIAYVSFRIAFG